MEVNGVGGSDVLQSLIDSEQMIVAAQEFSFKVSACYFILVYIYIYVYVYVYKVMYASIYTCMHTYIK